MSVSAASFLAIPCPFGCVKSSVIYFLFLAIESHQSEVPLYILRQVRSGSPVFGFSILITSAPKPAKIEAANGPAISCPISKTFNPASGRSTFLSDIITKKIPKTIFIDLYQILSYDSAARFFVNRIQTFYC